jgi:hypothetical protein
MLCCFIFFMAAEGFAETVQAPHQVSSLSTALSASAPLKIYYYNPEINASRNLVLKETWDTYLGEQLQFTFQPVDRQGDFKRLLENEPSAAFIMSEWLFNTLQLEQDAFFSLAMQGLKDGQDTYLRILVGQTTMFDPKKARIASSGDKARSLKILADIYPELSADQVAQLKILQVPKDIDALMALGYGLADVALTSQVSLMNMAKLNESRFQKLKIIKESKPLGQSILVFKSIEKADKENLVRSLIDMPGSEQGRQAISMIGLDAWKIVDAALSSMVSRVNAKTETAVADKTYEQASDENNNGGQNR